MSDPIRIADDVWGRGDALITQLEALSEKDVPITELYASAVDGLVDATNASQAKLTAVDNKDTFVSIQSPRLALKQDLAVHAEQPENDDETNTSVTTQKQLRTYNVSDSPIVFQLAVSYDPKPEDSLVAATTELSEAILAILTYAFTHRELQRLSATKRNESNQIQWIANLFGGATLQESFAAIATTVAEASGADRISLLKRRAGHYELVSTSTQSNVDRRAQQVRYLEDFVTESLDDQDEFSFDKEEVEKITQVGQQYLSSSGAKSLFLRTVYRPSDYSPAASQNHSAIAAIMLEKFDSKKANRVPHLNGVVDDAISLAIKRDEVSVSESVLKSVNRWSESVSNVRRISLLGLAALVSIALLAFVPAELKIPVSGTLVTAKTQKLFSPTDAVTDEVLVQNGERVSAGDPLIRLRSAKLDLLSEQIKGELLVARTELSIAEASRSSSGRASDSASLSSTASKQEVLKARIRGLSTQERLVSKQLEALVVRSPIDGVVDRWDIDQSLAHRVVAHGEYLLDIVSPEEGWEIQLDIPESDSGYVIAAYQKRTVECSLHLSSATENEFSNRLDSLDQATIIDRVGQPVLRGTVHVNDTVSTESFRIGATVHGSIQCGKQSIGFVWFRSLIQWWRQQSWL